MSEISKQPLTQLRGARVAADTPRAARIVFGIALVALLVGSIILFVSGANKNSQADALHSHGVPVVITVKSCIGLLGGSGSNAAGYSCQGTFTRDNHRYEVNVPGTALHSPRSTVNAVSAANDPRLVSSVREAAKDQSSGGVYILPSLLAAAFMVATFVSLKRRQRSAKSVI